MSEKKTGFIGTYTEGAYGGRGIYSFTLDDKTGALEGLTLAAETVNPSYLACFSIGPQGLLTPEDWVSSWGKTPRDFCFSPGGDFLGVCNQDSDNAAVFQVDAVTGKLTLRGEYPVPAPVCLVF